MPLSFPAELKSRRIRRHYHHQIALTAWISLNLCLQPSLASFATGRSSKLHPLSAHSWCKFLQFGQWQRVHEKRSIEERHLWVRPCFSISVQHVLFVLLELFLRSEESGRTATVLWGVASEKYYVYITWIALYLYACIRPTAPLQKGCDTRSFFIWVWLIWIHGLFLLLDYLPYYTRVENHNFEEKWCTFSFSKGISQKLNANNLR